MLPSVVERFLRYVTVDTQSSERSSTSPSTPGQVEIVTASGATLLGADDKTGVAEIVTAVERLTARPGIPHGAYPGGLLEVQVEESYRNMREVLDRHPEAVECAKEAMRRAGIEPVRRPIRGGTDGARLSHLGLPTPNLFAGQHNIHSRLEWISAQDMEAAVEVIVRLCRVWEERAPPVTGLR